MSGTRVRVRGPGLRGVDARTSAVEPPGSEGEPEGGGGGARPPALHVRPLFVLNVLPEPSKRFGVSDWGGPEHTEPLAYARRLSLSL